MNILPNFLVVGASKSGTSSLYHYLKQHPDIFLSEKQKEGRFFSQMVNCFDGPGDTIVEKTITKDVESYKLLFEGYNREKAIGDISPEYLYFHEQAIPLIKSTLGNDVRIIMILRNPVDRAFSAYTHFKRDKRESLSFEEALEKEMERENQHWLWTWKYKHSGFYTKQVKAYLDNFKQVKVFLYDDLLNSQAKVLEEICACIGVDSGFEFDTTYKYNVSGDPRNQLLYKLETSRGLIQALKKVIPSGIVAKIKKKWTGEKQMVKSEMSPETRLSLIGFFREDILELQKLINRDLTHWMK